MTEREKLLAIFCVLSLLGHVVREATSAFWQRRREDARQKLAARTWGGLRQLAKAHGITLVDETAAKLPPDVFSDEGLSTSDKWAIGEAFRKSAQELDPTATRAEAPSRELLQRAARTPGTPLPALACSCSGGAEVRRYDPECPIHGRGGAR